MIPAEQLKLRTGDVSFAFGKSGAVATMSYEVYHATLGDVIGRGTLSATSPTVSDLNRSGDKLVQQAEGAFIEFKARHADIIDGHSAHDADLILDGWWFDGETMGHPVCGVFPSYAQTFAQRVRAVLAQALPPPTWFWAIAGEGELFVKCTPVPGADSFNVYDGDEFVDNVADYDWSILEMDPGAYSVRMAAVKDGQSGVPSFPVSVTVVGVEEQAAMMGASAEAEGGMRRFWQWALFGE